MRFSSKEVITPTVLSIVSASAAQDRILKEGVVTAAERADSSQSILGAITVIESGTIQQLAIHEAEDLLSLPASLSL